LKRELCCGDFSAGEMPVFPYSRPMPSIGRRCHELKILDRDEAWRIIYRLDFDAIVIVDVFSKRTQKTPVPIIDRCRGAIAPL